LNIHTLIHGKNVDERSHVTATFRRVIHKSSLSSRVSFQPICLALITFGGDQLTLESAWSSITIAGEEVKLAFDFLKMCDGTKTLTQILENFSGLITEESALEFLENLRGHGIVYDSREIYLFLHRFSCNPSPYYCTPTDGDILDMLCHPLEESIRDLEGIVQLPSIDAELTRILSLRSSCREYDPIYEFSIEILGYLLWCMYGITYSKRITEDVVVNCHTVPSGGALYSLEIYAIVARKMTGLPIGVYRYRSERHDLILWSNNTNEVIQGIVGEDVQSSIKEAGILFVIVGHFPMSSQKYSNRGYLYTLYEAGAVMQNCYLAISRFNLGCCAIGGFKESLLASALGFSNYETMPLLAIIVGSPKK